MLKTKKKKVAKRMQEVNSRSIFNFDEQIAPSKKHNIPKKKKSNNNNDYYIGVKNAEPISKKNKKDMTKYHFS